MAENYERDCTSVDAEKISMPENQDHVDGAGGAKRRLQSSPASRDGDEEEGKGGEIRNISKQSGDMVVTSPSDLTSALEFLLMCRAGVNEMVAFCQEEEEEEGKDTSHDQSAAHEQHADSLTTQAFFRLCDSLTPFVKEWTDFSISQGQAAMQPLGPVSVAAPTSPTMECPPNKKQRVDAPDECHLLSPAFDERIQKLLRTVSGWGVEWSFLHTHLTLLRSTLKILSIAGFRGICLTEDVEIDIETHVPQLLSLLASDDPVRVVGGSGCLQATRSATRQRSVDARQRWQESVERLNATLSSINLFVALPPELVGHIFTFIEPAYFCHVARVCKLFAEVARARHIPEFRFTSDSDYPWSQVVPRFPSFSNLSPHEPVRLIYEAGWVPDDRSPTNNPLMIKGIGCLTSLQELDVLSLAKDNLVFLGDLPQLTSFTCRDCCSETNCYPSGMIHQFTDGDMAVLLQALPKLKTLALRRVRLSDEGVELIARFGTNLSTVELDPVGENDNPFCRRESSGRHHLTAFSFRSLSKMPSLTSLSLNYGPNLRDVSYLSDCQSLRSLTLSNQGVVRQETALAQLSGAHLVQGCGIAGLALTSLESLNLSGSKATDEDLSFPSTVQTSLTSLNLSGCDISDKILTTLIAPMQQLTSLSLRACSKVTLNGIISLSGLTRLTEFEFPSWQSIREFSDWMNGSTARSGIMNFTRVVRSIHYWGYDDYEYDEGTIDDATRAAGIACLASLTGLRSLRLRCEGLTNASLGPITALSGLRTLELETYYGSEVTADCLGILSAFQGLTELRLQLQDREWPASATEGLQCCTALKALDLCGPDVPPDLTGFFSRLTRLEDLRLCCCDFGKSSASILSNLRRLKSLNTFSDLDHVIGMLFRDELVVLTCLQQLQRTHQNASYYWCMSESLNHEEERKHRHAHLAQLTEFKKALPNCIMTHHPLGT